MDAGRITDTILNASEQAIAGQSEVVFINGMYWNEVAMSFSSLQRLALPSCRCPSWHRFRISRAWTGRWPLPLISRHPVS
nr:hypothetical protein [Jannaschia helgolandensis]